MRATDIDVVREAFQQLFPNRDFVYTVELKYSDHFKDYNANVKQLGNHLEFGLSKKWRYVSKEIKIGLLQELMLSLFRLKKTTTNTDLYNRFIKNLHIAVEKINTHPVLEDSFERVNDSFFHGLVEKPNLVLGNSSRRVMAHYEYQTDTIVFSRLLLKDAELLDYVMYHELLHKKLKFKHGNGRNYHHTTEFRKLEQRFPDHKEMERRLRMLR
ncbi:M48 family metallopeptidase [Candidatus Woesearchaeota archaeon]|nr:M48 family metallopeptidase [Candidatus Woesearchaeota archaeon]